MKIDHADIVTSHKCNFHCPFCIDRFCHGSEDEVTVEMVQRFLDKLKPFSTPGTEVLLLGGEPTMLSTEKLIDLAGCIRRNGFSPIMSTNGFFKSKIHKILPYYDWVQITVRTQKDIDEWADWTSKVNVKLSGDKSFDMQRLAWFDKATEGFKRRSVSMYFTPEFKELCEDEDVWKLLDGLEWRRNGSYRYAFWHNIRFKKCVHGETNVIDEPTVPKLYPNGNYNKTWNNEDLDDYLVLPLE